ncbi:lachesin-like [Uloborus diversus]|uniref:lachesin-like n=1 Tax=Uloborus diversus TaxID=327109 RepID=UPI0024094924|nr:lachesin-like [Uloborus diversus]
MLWKVIVLFALVMDSTASKTDLEPEFADRIMNKTVKVGEDVELSCITENLGSYRVAWIRVESQTILSIHTHVITRNYRISLNHKDHTHWNLHIEDVHAEDRGSYMCQINTVPMKKQIGFLEVVVPPQFSNTDRNSEILAREGTNVSLSCTVTGHPQPSVSWQREDGQAFHAGPTHNKDQQYATYEGEVLTISKVSRLHMGTYLCTANNSVPPIVTRRIQLYVHFPPMLWIPNQLIGGSVGRSLTLECLVEAFPKSLNYWTKQDGQLVISGDRHAVTLQENTYKIHMKLTILFLIKEDFGTYLCLARNSLGSTEGAIKIYEIIDPHSTSTAKTDYIEDERLEMLDDSLSRERNFPNQSPVQEIVSTQAGQLYNDNRTMNGLRLVKTIPYGGIYDNSRQRFIAAAFLVA